MNSVAGNNIGWAVRAMRAGERVCRRGWNGGGVYLFLVPGGQFKVNRPPLLGIYPGGTEINYHARVGLRTATGEIIPWNCSQADLLADDWELADE